jgi:N-formylglutamate deformylase
MAPQMDFSSFQMPDPDLVVAIALHDGHDLRPAISPMMKLDDATRLREEDPHTGSIASRFGANAVVHRSRFEVDLNRPRNGAIYRGPEDAWGLDVWKAPLSESQISTSLGLYDGFYAELGSSLVDLVDAFGGFVVYDIHSYNHRRAGPNSPPDPTGESPTINLGTGSLPERWVPIADVFVESLRSFALNGEPLDVRSNVRFQGGHLAHWVHENYGHAGCALAIEMKKIFMDEWTGELDGEALDRLGEALVASMGPVRARFRQS